MGLAGGNGTGAGRLARRARNLTLGLAVMLAVACSPVFRNHGYAPEDTDLAQIEVGRDTRETVAEVVGRPSAAGLLNDEGWYYVQSRYRHYGARAPQEVDRQVVAISFTPEGVVQNVERFGLEQGRVVPLSRRVTETNVRGVSLISQLLGGLGRIRAEDVLE
ncbi:outer membrane protein assembly factor BamE [Fertoebacter nigrum]|uniref:Outer membrane protein assembly factor BamE n=1 Tax=Fertoeibacter niger TaxID=2656921 RepID=A0A8X8GRZ4_9RHOB|nr:outer membrane protein assembly factor BamE [Fertoeibacter niger]